MDMLVLVNSITALSWPPTHLFRLQPVQHHLSQLVPLAGLEELQERLEGQGDHLPALG